LLTVAPPPTQSSDTVIDGVLGYDADHGCLFLDTGGTRLYPLWPRGAEWADNPLGVRLMDGTRLASVGDRITALRSKAVAVAYAYDGASPTATAPCGAAPGNFVVVEHS